MYQSIFDFLIDQKIYPGLSLVLEFENFMRNLTKSDKNNSDYSYTCKFIYSPYSCTVRYPKDVLSVAWKKFLDHKKQGAIFMV